ncbi:rhodanese-like domain-containing protein [Oceaniserpentilla sp. 4NH20-0058]|uniref:rhodanese-like domain-containing protein n=1 Tax=Oceaniserpentilla sp. 4NH20-0058 TaxID=3127660 RepID=UPI0031076B95
MAQFVEFVANNWILVSALLVLLTLLAWDSGQKAGPKVSTHEATRLINQNNAVVLDIRDKADFKAGHLVDSVHIPNSQVAERISDLEKHKSDPIIVVCKTGQTASAASKTLKDNGFAQVYRLSGGIMEWTNNNLPLVKK